MTKHFCDKCGKETQLVWLVQFGSVQAHPLSQHVPNETMEVCETCKNTMQEPYPAALEPLPSRYQLR